MPANPGREPARDHFGDGQDDLQWPLPQSGPMGRGVQMDMGPTVVIDTGAAEIALISRHVEPSDLNCLCQPRHRPDAEALRNAEKPHPLARRSRQTWRRRVVDCAGVGVCTSDYGQLAIQQRQAPDLPARPAQPLRLAHPAPMRLGGTPNRPEISKLCRGWIFDQIEPPFDAVEPIMHPVKPRVDLRNVDGNLCDGPFERTETKPLLALLFANQPDFVEQAAALLRDEFETDPWIAHRDLYGAGPGSSQSKRADKKEAIMDGTCSISTDRRSGSPVAPSRTTTGAALCRPRGRGRMLRDAEGREYIDGLSGLWNVNVGHGRGELADAAAEQMRKIAFASAYVGATNEPAVRLAEKIVGHAYSNSSAVYFTTAGAESNEIAFKFARYYWKIKDKPKRPRSSRASTPITASRWRR